MLTDKKRIILSEIENDVHSAVSSQLDRLTYGYGSPKEVIQEAIVNGVTIAFARMFDRMYTAEEFEEDIGLK